MHILTKQELSEKALPAFCKIFTDRPNHSVNVHSIIYSGGDSEVVMWLKALPVGHYSHV